MREIRRVKMNEQTWYMAADICNEVGISNCTVAMRSISPEHKRKLPFGSKGAAEKQFLNESGVYELLKRTRKPGAEEFEKWFAEWLAGGMVEVEPEQEPDESPEGQDNEIKMEGEMKMEVSNAGAMTVFENAEFGDIRILRDGEKCMFCAKDVAKALGYKDTVNAIKAHCRWVAKYNLPHPQSPSKEIEMAFVPEGDVYRLIASSKLPSAEKFEKWVFDEVLPSIRKHGMYATESTLQQMINNPDMIVMMAQRMLDEKARADTAEAKVAELESSVSSLKAENSALVGDITMWDSRALLNALIRKYAAVHMDNDFAGAWRAFYKELLYKEGISVAGRSKSGSKLNTLTEEEVIAGVSVAIAMCRRCAVDVEDIVGHADHAAAVVA